MRKGDIIDLQAAARQLYMLGVGDSVAICAYSLVQGKTVFERTVGTGTITALGNTSVLVQSGKISSEYSTRDCKINLSKGMRPEFLLILPLT